jgi:plastocyanin
MKKLALTLSLLALAGFGVAACGDDDDDETSAATTTTTTSATTPDESVHVEADPSGALEYTETELSVPAGSVTVDFVNPSSTDHDVVVEDADGNELIRTEIISDSAAAATGELEPGTYTYYCSVDAHREAGMEGTLTVE